MTHLDPSVSARFECSNHDGMYSRRMLDPYSKPGPQLLRARRCHFVLCSGWCMSCAYVLVAYRTFFEEFICIMYMRPVQVEDERFNTTRLQKGSTVAT